MLEEEQEKRDFELALRMAQVSHIYLVCGRGG